MNYLTTFEKTFPWKFLFNEPAHPSFPLCLCTIQCTCFPAEVKHPVVEVDGVEQLSAVGHVVGVDLSTALEVPHHADQFA